MICSIVHEHPSCLWIDGNTVNIVEVAGPLVIWWISFLAPVEYKLAVLIEFRDARSVVSIRHEQRAVGKPSQESGTIEVRAVSARHLGSAHSLHEFLSIVREFVDRVHVVIKNPQVLFRVIRIDGYEVRSL